MASSLQAINVEGFITDLAFIDNAKTINETLSGATTGVCALNVKGLSYFNDPFTFVDTRAPSARLVNWAATTSSKVIIDNTSYGSFISTINSLGTSISTGFFKILDKLLFDFNSNTTSAIIESGFLADPDISPIYVPGSFSLSTDDISATLYTSSGTSTVGIPAFASFTLSIISGTTTEYYRLTIFASLQSWLSDYSISTVTTVIPPLPYSDLYLDPLTSTNNNVFATATLTANLSYNTAQAILASESISGMSNYNATVTDVSGNIVNVPFNVLYKGQIPTQAAIRTAIINSLLSSGVGTQAGWKARLPGVFVLGRYYLIPLWDKTYSKPDQILFPSIVAATEYSRIANKVLFSLGGGDVTPYIDVLPVFFNKMTVLSVQDLNNPNPMPLLDTVIPDYQSYSSTEENFTYMETNTQMFSASLNNILSINTLNTQQTTYNLDTENALSFYTFDTANYEFCVISKDSYITNMESAQ